MIRTLIKLLSGSRILEFKITKSNCKYCLREIDISPQESELGYHIECKIEIEEFNSGKYEGYIIGGKELEALQSLEEIFNSNGYQCVPINDQFSIKKIGVTINNHHVESINLVHLKLKILPECIKNFTELRILSCTNNKLKTL